jgi:anti-anti-sigma factor
LERIVTAPEVLGLDEREAFRQAALTELAAVATGRGRLVVDLCGTRSIDSAGLGTLLLVQRYAAERQIPVVLRSPTSEVRFLLMVTRLDSLFELDPLGTDAP